MTEYTFKHIDGSKCVIIADSERKAWKKMHIYLLEPMDTAWKDEWEIIVTIISKRSEKPCVDQRSYPVGCKHRCLNLKEMRYLCYYLPDNPNKCSRIWYSIYRVGEDVAATMFDSILSVETYMEEHDMNVADYEVKEVSNP